MRPAAAVRSNASNVSYVGPLASTRVNTMSCNATPAYVSVQTYAIHDADDTYTAFRSEVVFDTHTYTYIN